MEKIEKKIYELKKYITELRIAKTDLEMQLVEMEDEICSENGSDVDMYFYYAKLNQIKKYEKEITKKEKYLDKLMRKAKKKAKK